MHSNSFPGFICLILQSLLQMIATPPPFLSSERSFLEMVYPSGQIKCYGILLCLVLLLDISVEKKDKLLVTFLAQGKHSLYFAKKMLAAANTDDADINIVSARLV